jgi:NitT/TauT family transport system substrate-binding protein
VIAGLILLQAALSIAVTGPATNPEYLPLRVAAAEGYFTEEKLTVTLETLRAEPLAAQALGRGRVALAATSLDAALSLGHAGSAPPRLVFGLTAAPPVALLVPAAKKDSVKALADLTGKTIGIIAPGTPGELALFALLAREGIGVHQITTQSFGERALVGALESAAIEAAMVQDPWASRLIDEGKAVALADLRTAAEAARWLGGPTVDAALFVSADTKLGRAELIPLARALLRALARIRAATADELLAVLPAAVVGAPEDFALRLRGARGVYLPDGQVSDDAFRRSVALVRARTVIPAKVDMPRRLDKLLLMAPLEEALRRRP